MRAAVAAEAAATGFPLAPIDGAAVGNGGVRVGMRGRAAPLSPHGGGGGVGGGGEGVAARSTGAAATASSAAETSLAAATLAVSSASDVRTYAASPAYGIGGRWRGIQGAGHGWGGYGGFVEDGAYGVWPTS